MQSTKQLRPLELERNVDDYAHSNTVEVNTDEGKIIYTGKVGRFYFEGTDIRAWPYITKEIEIHKTYRNYLRNWKEKIVKKVEWQLNTVDRTKSTPYLVRNGQLKNDPQDASGYRHAVKNFAANQGILLSNELLDKIFSPIDEQVMRMYTDSKSFK